MDFEDSQAGVWGSGEEGCGLMTPRLIVCAFDTWAALDCNTWRVYSGFLAYCRTSDLLFG